MLGEPCYKPVTSSKERIPAKSMKTLLLLRHAKSSWKDATVTDHDRRLNERGRKAAEVMRRFMKEKDLDLDLILSSSSARTRETVGILFAGISPAPEIRFDDGLYLASAATLLETVTALEEDLNQVLLVGHNPGIAELCFRLTGADHRFPTATLASIRLNAENWSNVERTGGRLEWLVTPKELETS